MLIPAKATWTNEDTGEVHTYKTMGEVDVYALAPCDCVTGWFWEWDLDLFGWNLGIAVDIDPQPARWGLYAQWLRCHRASLFDWLGSFASLTLCLGPVAVSVSALRTTAKVLRAWKARDSATTPATPEPESPLAGVRHAIYFDAE